MIVVKLRLRENSIRLRLLRGEVAALRATGRVTETISFGASQLLYTLQIASEAKDISANFTDNKITITLPNATAQNWAESNEVGIEAEQIVAEHGTLKILVEKDFVCLDRAGDADNADAYEHPGSNC